MRCLIQIGSYDGHKFFTPLQMKEVLDHNYITMHLFRVLLSQGFRREEISDEQYSGRKSHIGNDTFLSTGRESVTVEDGKTGFQSVNDKIFGLISQMGERTRRPVAFGSIFAVLKSEFSVSEIRNGIDDLIENGSIRKMRDTDEYEIY